MRFPLALFSMLALTSALALSPTAKGDPVVECGDLDVMVVPAADLPEGVSPSDVRKCKDHPLGNNRHVKGASLAPLDAVDVLFLTNNTTASAEIHALQDRACYKDAPYGCSGGYCWKVCGNKGEWCWTAKKGGVGAWYTCSSYKDCGTIKPSGSFRSLLVAD
ncbi:hypothetical protein BO78DRAFT_383762 [Aspergillus sclerotiicarbonarius CBS 121057]|uniref:IDI-2 n=1 Tax=Aspergillus sclerotiicarbonarius (strain CBS 121057 / IBT 28362) TaxID=1448318 RepID=A0A319EQL8_ASPSB|nr:hypothetical protein BO78DRAFT_383762 [Aspergillus sclerotiicarbonarius CBS 121057]